MSTLRVPIPIIGPSSKNRVSSLSAQFIKNFYPVIDESGREIISFQCTPGLKAFATPTAGANRGAFLFKEKVYTVSSQTLFSVDAAGATASIGTVEGAERCTFSRNGDYLIIATEGSVGTINGYTLYEPGAKFYSYDGTTFAEISDPDIGTGDPGQFWVSDLNLPLTISSLSFAMAESNPDDMPRLFVQGETVFMFGTLSLEQWYNSGSGTPPFSRIQGGTKEFGTIAKHSVAANDERVYFLDHARTPRAAIGGQPQDIGNASLGKEFESYSRVDDAIGWVHEWDGDRYYTLTFPSADKTWCYSEKVNWWFPLSSGTSNGRHCGNDCLRAFNRNLVFDAQTSAVYSWDFDTFTDDGNVIQRQRDTQVVHSGLYGQRGVEVFYSSLELVMKTGIGIATGQGDDPVVAMQFSDDDGGTWSSERYAKVGKMGKKTRVIFNDLGSAYDRIFRFKMSDPVRWSLISAHAEIEFGI